MVGMGAKGRMRDTDKSRKWMWWFLGAVAGFQLYFVRELLAAFALFAVGFAFLAAIVTGVYLLQKTWEAGLARVQQHSKPVITVAQRGLSFAEAVVKRPFTRAGSQPVQ